METITKIIKEILFNDDEVDIKIIAKIRYILIGIVIGVSLAFAGLCYWAEGEDSVCDTYIELADE